MPFMLPRSPRLQLAVLFAAAGSPLSRVLNAGLNSAHLRRNCFVKLVTSQHMLRRTHENEAQACRIPLAS